MAHHTPSDSPRTLTEALAPYALPESSFRQYIPFRNVTKRVLGEDVSFYPIMTLSPVAIHTHIGLFRPSFHSPFVELGLSTVTSGLLHTAFVASTSTFECAYCLAHGLALGNMISGAMEDQIGRGCTLPKYSVNPEADHLTPVQSAVIRLAIAISKRKNTAPKHQLLPLCDTLCRLFRDGGSSNGSHDVEVIKSLLCFVDTYMDVMGVQLEPRANAFATACASELKMDFEPGIHASAAHNGDSQSHEVSVSRSYVGGVLENFMSLVRLFPDLIAMMALEREIYREIPTNRQALDDWLKHQFHGDVPQFMANIQRLGFKQAVCLGLHENVLGGSENSGHGVDRSEKKWTKKERCGLMYVYGSEVGCEDMCMLAERLYADSNSSDFESLLNSQECEIKWSSGFVAAKTVVVEHILRAENVSTETIQWITREVGAEGGVEVASLISFSCFLHRVVMLFNDKEMCQ